MNSKTIICIPCYNCENQISRVIAEFDKSLLDRVEKIILVDNHSVDHTVDFALREISKSENPDKFTILKNPINRGLGGTHKVAFSTAIKENADYVAILHGDNQARTMELNSLMDAAQKNPHFSAILGSRFMKDSKRFGYSKLRTAGNIALNIFYSVLCFYKIKDLGSGINMFKVSDLDLKKINKYSDSFTFNMDLLLGFIRSRKPICFIPITWRETDQKSNAKTFNVGLISLLTLLKWRFSSR